LRAGRLQAALARVDQALKVLPSYAEAWNLRATILFHQGEDVASVAAIERTLALEPRHFGALSGMVLINMRAQSWDGALAALRAGLKVHPFLHKPALVEQLEDLAKGKEL
jgi:tetratricopeptide (TPR) repeat protein